MSAWFDLTGTMIITSFLYLLGPRGLFIEFRGGAVLVLAFMLAYTAKWHRRSGCMTPAEWTTYRFGTGFSGELLRFISAIMGIVITIGLLAYLVRGATLFMGMIFPVDPLFLTIAILAFSAIYTVLSGFYGVVLTDLVQGIIMITGCIVLSVIAWHEVPDAATLAATAKQVTGNIDWVSSVPSWHTTMPKGYEAYQSLIMVMLFYLLRNILGGLGTGAEPRFFAARNSREASLQCMMQGLTVMFRWPLMMSFAILGIFLVARMLPDSATTEHAAQLIRDAQPGIADNSWHAYTSKIVHFPKAAPPELIAKMEQTLGPDWQGKLLLIGPRGTVNPEVVLPAVLLNSLAPGARGLLIVSLLAALMGVLTGNVNGSSALFVRDIYQNFLRPKAKNLELISVAHLSSVGIILVSFILGLSAASINDLWSWLIMGFNGRDARAGSYAALLVAHECVGHGHRNVLRRHGRDPATRVRSNHAGMAATALDVHPLARGHNRRLPGHGPNPRSDTAPFLSHHATLRLVGPLLEGLATRGEKPPGPRTSFRHARRRFRPDLASLPLFAAHAGADP